MSCKEDELVRWLHERRAQPLVRLADQPDAQEPVVVASVRDMETGRTSVERVWAVGDALKRQMAHWPSEGVHALWIQLNSDGRTLTGHARLYVRGEEL